MLLKGFPNWTPMDIQNISNMSSVKKMKIITQFNQNYGIYIKMLKIANH